MKGTGDRIIFSEEEVELYSLKCKEYIIEDIFKYVYIISPCLYSQ